MKGGSVIRVRHDVTPAPLPQGGEGGVILLVKRDPLELTHSLAPLGERGGGEGVPHQRSAQIWYTTGEGVARRFRVPPL